MFTRRATLSGLLAIPLAPSVLPTPKPWPEQLIEAARAQIGVTVSYDPAYRGLDYPMGDVPRSTGVCTDVVIRAYRDAFGLDLQKLVHEDMRAAFNAFPDIWGLTGTDRNIDHRRVLNLETFLTRADAARDDLGWQPGDLMTCRVPGNLPHIAIVSDRRHVSGRFLVIHNIGRGTQEEDLLGTYAAERRFRYLPA